MTRSSPALRSWTAVASVFGCLALAASIGACQSRKIDNTMILDPGDSPSDAADIRPIFATSCGGESCHIGETTSGVNLTTHVGTIASVGLQYDRRVVLPGDAANSPLADKIGSTPEFGQRMPSGRAPLSAQQIALIRQWIDEGAEDN